MSERFESDEPVVPAGSGEPEGPDAGAGEPVGAPADPATGGETPPDALAADAGDEVDVAEVDPDEAEPAGEPVDEALEEEAPEEEAPEDEAPEVDGAPDEAAAAPSRRPRRRRAAEVSTQPRRRQPVVRPDGQPVAVRAQARYVRTAPRKARLVIDHIRGKSIDDARAILRHTPRDAARDVLKLLESAVANAENNHELDPDDLKVGLAYVDEGPTIKRFRPRALGRATRIHKRTSHLTITLISKE